MVDNISAALKMEEEEKKVIYMPPDQVVQVLALDGDLGTGT